MTRGVASSLKTEAQPTFLSEATTFGPNFARGCVSKLGRNGPIKKPKPDLEVSAKTEFSHPRIGEVACF